MHDEGGWWAGDCEELMSVGPFQTEQEAIQEALDGHYCDESEIDGKFKRVVFSLEAKGTYFDCDECGTVERACDDCLDWIDDGEFKFLNVRNERRSIHDLEDSSVKEQERQNG